MPRASGVCPCALSLAQIARLSSDQTGGLPRNDLRLERRGTVSHDHTASKHQSSGLRAVDENVGPVQLSHAGTLT